MIFPAGSTTCDSWTGDINSIEEFEVSACSCSDASCSQWTCFEKGLHYYDSKLGWIAFGLLLGTAGFIATLCTLYMVSGCWRLLAIIPASFYVGLMFVTVMMGGVISWLVVTVVQLIIWLLIEVCFPGSVPQRTRLGGLVVAFHLTRLSISVFFVLNFFI